MVSIFCFDSIRRDFRYCVEFDMKYDRGLNIDSIASATTYSGPYNTNEPEKHGSIDIYFFI